MVRTLPIRSHDFFMLCSQDDYGPTLDRLIVVPACAVVDPLHTASRSIDAESPVALALVRMEL